jgi:hypothetical protein|tara:strand:- start:416 stop:628 length:213 start_codon:yes stop_codon:yes gene_type:complete
MDIGDQSVEFVQKQIEQNFKQIMANNVIESMYWIDTLEGARGVAIMHEIVKDKIVDNNLIVLFPPFIPKD